MSLERVKELSRGYAASDKPGEWVFHHCLEYGSLYKSLTPGQQEYADQYAICLAEGCSPTLADMFASQTPPMSNTDREFLEGHCCGNQFASRPWEGDRLKEVAEAHGQDVTGKVYVGGLARFPGDPEAWVSGRGDVQRVVESRGWSSEGAVNVAPRDVPKAPTRTAKPGSLAARLYAAGLPLAGG